MAPSSHPDQELITERQANYVKCYNAADVEGILSHMSEDVDFCDFSIGVLHLNKAALYTFTTNVYASCANLEVKTVSISGHKNFTTWEWNLTFNYVKPAVQEATNEPELQADMADGRLMRMIGVSVTWWNDEGKIYRNHDYGKIVESFDGRGSE